MFHFQLVKVFLCKKFKNFGCANRNEWISPDLCEFRSNLAQTRWPTACVRTSCEHPCEHPCEQKTLKKQVVRKSCENVRNVRNPCEQTAWKKQVVRKSCERCEFHQNILNFAPKSAYSNFWPKIAWICSKNLNILFSDRKPPEFALKSAYWIFWPILARFFQKPAHFKFLTENRLSFPRIALFWLWQKLARLYPAKCASWFLPENRPSLPRNSCRASFWPKITQTCTHRLSSWSVQGSSLPSILWSKQST